MVDRYVVMILATGRRTERAMKGGSFTKRKDAVAFYRRHPRATRIQKWSGQLTAGSFQPDAAKSIRRKRTVYVRAYHGPHTKAEARAIVREFRKTGWLATYTQTKHGCFVYLGPRSK